MQDEFRNAFVRNWGEGHRRREWFNFLLGLVCDEFDTLFWISRIFYNSKVCNYNYQSSYKLLMNSLYFKINARNTFSIN